MYSFPEPPYFLLIAGLFIGITSGLAFYATLQSSVNAWAKQRSTRILASLQGVQLITPYLGIMLGIVLFLASGLEIFGFPANISYALAIFMTIATGGLLWYQLGVVLIQIERGGSRALDLDAL